MQPLAGFEGRIPTRAETENVGAWARAVGPEGGMWRGLDPKLAVQAIEFGNETSFAYQGTQKRGGEYARLARDASRAANAAGVGLFIQADDANQVDGWINQMYDAVPTCTSTPPHGSCTRTATSGGVGSTGRSPGPRRTARRRSRSRSRSTASPTTAGAA